MQKAKQSHMAKGPFVVLSCYQTTSKFDGGSLDVITMCNVDGQIVHSYLDPGNKNYSQWRDILDLFDKGCGVVVDNLKYKIRHGEVMNRHIKDWNIEEPIINADSRPEIIKLTLELQELVDAFYDALK